MTELDGKVISDVERLLKKKGYRQGKIKLHIWWKIVHIDGVEYRVYMDLEQMVCYMYKAGHKGPSCTPPEEEKALMMQIYGLKDVTQTRLC